MAVIPDFYGNRAQDTVCAADFIKKCQSFFSGSNATIAEKLEEVENHFMHNSPADRWFRDIRPADPRLADWASFKAAFQARFQVVDPVPKPAAQLQAALGGMRIGMGELAKGSVLVGGQKIPVLRDFAMRVNDAVTEANAGTQSGGIMWTFLEGLPLWLRSAVGDPANWDAMVAALLAVPDNVVEAAVIAHREKAAVDSKIEELARQLKNTRVAPAPPMQTQAGPSRGAAQAGGGANTAAGGGGGGGGAGGRGAAAGGGGNGRFVERVLSDAQRSVLRGLKEGGNARHAPDTAEGRALYATQLAEWAARNAHVPREALDVAVTGYPLTPGTADAGTGECWRCGFSEIPYHGGKGCNGHPELPQLERRFRSLCGRYLGNDRATGVNVVEAEDVEGRAWFEEAAAPAGDGGGQGF
ncbi:hypothetical protein C8R46DRAFT_1224897 [Mycena filopes]|nr:hypothetical protein C8R46DRAFT_1224897 [Mycena filopes]